MTTKTYNVVAQRATGGPYLLTEVALDDLIANPRDAKVIQYDASTGVAWLPWLLGSYLARGYWYDADIDTLVVDIQNWRDPAQPGKVFARPNEGETREEFTERLIVTLRAAGIMKDEK